MVKNGNESVFTTDAGKWIIDRPERNFVRNAKSDLLASSQLNSGESAWSDWPDDPSNAIVVAYEPSTQDEFPWAEYKFNVDTARDDYEISLETRDWDNSAAWLMNYEIEVYVDGTLAGTVSIPVDNSEFKKGTLVGMNLSAGEHQVKYRWKNAPQWGIPTSLVIKKPTIYGSEIKHLDAEIKGNLPAGCMKCVLMDFLDPAIHQNLNPSCLQIDR